jgi:hypothetical protein
MRRAVRAALLVPALIVLATSAGVAAQAEGNEGMTHGKPDIKSMSVLAFGEDGTLFIGDGQGGAVFAIDLGDDKPPAKKGEAAGLKDVEAKIGARLGASGSEVMVHDMAVHPISQKIYMSVSRGRGKWNSNWILPNDIANAQVLLTIAGESIDMVGLDDVSYAKTSLPNPVAGGKKHMWKEGIELRADTITDMALAGDTLYVAGLSNEEFASTMWRIPYPFGSDVAATTLEVYHGAHGEYETHAPIRTFLPYRLNGSDHLLAAYLCTPLVTFPTVNLKDGQHVKGRTIGEFGSGNYPIDMVVYEKNGVEQLLIANSNLPFMIVDPKKVEAFKGSITTEVEGYIAGVEYEYRSGSGILQMDRLNGEFIVALQRQAGGTVDLISLPVGRF